MLTLALLLAFAGAAEAAQAEGDSSACRSAPLSLLVEEWARQPRRRPQQAQDALSSYFLCRALAAGAVGPCTALDPILNLDSESLGELCREDLERALFLKALATDQNAARALCPRAIRAFIHLCRLGYEGEQGQEGRACAIVFQNLRNAQAASDKLEAACPSPMSQQQREAQLSWLLILTGQDASCAAAVTLERRRNCQDFGAFRAALAAGDARRCGDSGICRVLLGGKAAACEPYAARLREVSCRAGSPARPPAP